MRLIDADALIKSIEGDRDCSDMPSQWIDGVNYAIDLIKLYEPTIDAVEVVRCRECKWYEPRNILHADGTRTYVNEDAEMVTANVGINCAGRCIHHTGLKIYCVNHDRENPEDEQNIIIFRSPDDYCSYGEEAEK